MPSGLTALRHRLTGLSTVEPAARGGIAETLVVLGAAVDAAGRRTHIGDSDGTVRQYGYDAVDRLGSETVGGALGYGKAITYDKRDQLTLENATAYRYDLSGHLTSKAGDATYKWDHEYSLENVKRTRVRTLIPHSSESSEFEDLQGKSHAHPGSSINVGLRGARDFVGGLACLVER